MSMASPGQKICYPIQFFPCKIAGTFFTPFRINLGKVKKDAFIAPSDSPAEVAPMNPPVRSELPVIYLGTVCAATPAELSRKSYALALRNTLAHKNRDWVEGMFSRRVRRDGVVVPMTSIEVSAAFDDFKESMHFLVESYYDKISDEDYHDIKESCVKKDIYCNLLEHNAIVFRNYLDAVLGPVYKKYCSQNLFVNLCPLYHQKYIRDMMLDKMKTVPSLKFDLVIHENIYDAIDKFLSRKFMAYQIGLFSEDFFQPIS